MTLRLRTDAPLAVDAVELEEIFGDIDADDLDSHRSSPSVAGSQLVVRKGKPSIPLAGASSTAVWAPTSSRSSSGFEKRTTVSGDTGQARPARKTDPDLPHKTQAILIRTMFASN